MFKRIFFSLKEQNAPEEINEFIHDVINYRLRNFSPRLNNAQSYRVSMFKKTHVIKCFQNGFMLNDQQSFLPSHDYEFTETD